MPELNPSAQRCLSIFITYLLHAAESFLRSWPVFAASQEIPRSLWKPKVLPVPILSQFHPVPTTPSNFLNIHFNIILPSTSGSPQWPLSLRFPHQHPVHHSLLSHTRRSLLLGILIFKGLTVRIFFKSFVVKGLRYLVPTADLFYSPLNMYVFSIFLTFFTSVTEVTFSGRYSFWIPLLSFSLPYFSEQGQG
jgi:hypothetical protein